MPSPNPTGAVSVEFSREEIDAVLSWQAVVTGEGFTLNPLDKSAEAKLRAALSDTPVPSPTGQGESRYPDTAAMSGNRDGGTSSRPDTQDEQGEIARYRLDPEASWLEREDDGEFVRYSDHLSRLEAVEASRGSLIDRIAEAEQRADRLSEALRPVAELADRLAAKGHLAPDPKWQSDPDLIFPSVVFSVSDLERAHQALAHIHNEEESGE